VKLYRIEARSLKKTTLYYLVKDLRIGKSTLKIRINLGETRPDDETAEKLTSTPNRDLEFRALKKRLAKPHSVARYLTPKRQMELEETRYWAPTLETFLSPGEFNQIENIHETEHIAGTTAIEGNTLTVRQVDELINKGIAPQGKVLREINEVQNAVNAAKHRIAYSGKVTIPFILKLHALMLDKINDQAGVFRKRDDIGIAGRDIAVTPAIQIENELEEAISDYYKRIHDEGNPFEEAVIFHCRFESIHPFIDGNGRVGRELLRHLLSREGYPDILIGVNDREAYLHALEDWDEGRVADTVHAFSEILLKDKRGNLFKKILYGRVGQAD
jgi:fido (protein-threonine AMPylation protein)